MAANLSTIRNLVGINLILGLVTVILGGLL
jgi:uncharacterized membrane protein